MIPSLFLLFYFGQVLCFHVRMLPIATNIEFGPEQQHLNQTVPH